MKCYAKLRLQDLKVGMHVKTEQLSDLYGVWIYVDPTTINKDTDEVDILYFCTSETKDDKEIQKIQDKYGKASIIFQPAFYADENCNVYDD